MTTTTIVVNVTDLKQWARLPNIETISMHPLVHGATQIVAIVPNDQVVHIRELDFVCHVWIKTAL